MLCKNEGFWTWLGVESEEEARQHILTDLGMSSRAELDQSELLAEQFHDNFRKPFLRWQESA